MNLSELTDIYLPQKGNDFRAFSDGNRLIFDSGELIYTELTELLEACNKLNMGAGDDKYLCVEHNQYRVHLEQRKTVLQYSLRRLPKFIPSLTEGNPEGISFPKTLPKLIDKHTALKGGLIMLVGPMGSGKTTTSAAVINHILLKSGGVCWCLEDPPEYDLEGDYGENGICYQSPVDDGNFAKAIRSMMRCFPSSAQSTLFVGEVRDADTAMQVLQTLLNGARVVFTFHSGSPEEGITRFLSMCDGSEYARQILSDSLRLVIGMRKKPSLQGFSLDFDYLERSNSACAAIKQNQLNALKDVMLQQKNERSLSSDALSSLRRN